MPSPSNWRVERIRKIAERSGYSEAEVEEALTNQVDLICSESDMAWNGKPLSQVIKEAQQDRKNLLMAVHTLSESTRDLVSLVQERNNIMASAALMVTRRLGAAKPLPEIVSDEELRQGPGYYDSVGRIVPGGQKAEEETEPASGRAVETAPPPKAPEKAAPPEALPTPRSPEPDDETLNLSEILPEQSQSPRR